MLNTKPTVCETKTGNLFRRYGNLLAAVFLIFISNTANSQCGSISVINCATPVVANASGAGAWNINTCGYSTLGQERIYSFTPTVTGEHFFEVTSTNGGSWVDYFIKEASLGCNASNWTCIQDIHDPTTVSMGTLTAGVTYYILFDAEEIDFVTQTFQINCPVNSNTWLGGSTTDWNTGSNWSTGSTPTGIEDVSIPEGISPYPVLTASYAVNNLFIGLGATVGIANNTFTINGAVTGDGSIIGSSSSNLEIAGAAGNLNFDQSSADTRSLKNLTLNAGATASLGTALDITAGLAPGTVTVSSGATLASGGNLTLKSDDDGTARVGYSEGSITGDVTVERNIKNAGHRAWHLLGINTTGSQTIYNAWQEGGANVANQGTNITSNLYNGSNGFDMLSNSPSLLTHDQGGLSGPTWIANLSNTNATALSAWPGYLLFVRGDRNYTTSAPDPTSTNRTVLRSTGLLNQGTLAPVTVSATGTGRTLVGNSYASAIDMETILGPVSTLDQNFYVWDPALTGIYGAGGYRLVMRTGVNAYDQTPVVLGGTVNNDPSIQFIHSGSAFFLKATGADANVEFNENMKAVSTTTVYNPIVAAATDQQMLINLMIVNSGNIASLADGIRIRFNGAYSAGTTDDIMKLGNFGENISSYRNGEKLIVEKRPMIGSKDTIFLRMTNTGIKNYRLQLGTFDFVQPHILAYLQDTYLNTVSGINLTGAVNNFDFSITADPASANPGRFLILFAAGGTLPVTISSLKAAQQGNYIAVEWKVSNQLNMKQYEVEKSTDGINYVKMNTQAAAGTNGSDAIYDWLDVNAVTGSNFYRIRSVGIAGDVKLSQVVVVKTDKANTGISIYPNPVINRTIGVQFTNMEKGIYQLRLVNTMGQVLFSQFVNHNGGSATQTINPGKGLANGKYQLEIIKPDNSKTTKALIISD